MGERFRFGYIRGIQLDPSACKKILPMQIDRDMESRNIILAVMIAVIALGVFYMIDPTLGGLMGRKFEGFENNNNANNNATNNANNSGNNAPASMNGAPAGAFNAPNDDECNINANENIVGNNAHAAAVESFENLGSSPMPFAAAEKPANCYPKNQLSPQELLPNDPNSTWAQMNPQGAGDISGKNFLNAGHLIGVNTVGQSLRNASWDLRSEVPNPQTQVSPWQNSTISPDLSRRPLEIG